MDLKKVSKRLAYVLRHRPDSIGITLADGGWVDIETLLKALRAGGTRLTRAELMVVVAENDKQRFAVDGDRIRASQGHSVPVELGYAPATPPDRLYHGTVAAALDSILKQGLVRGNRHHVHLSADLDTAMKVGARRGKPVILTVDSGQMHLSGYQFFVTDNKVWLAAEVPPAFLTFDVRESGASFSL